jgi:L-alanine-DL-glutamate epimerase-like enolase superfamily enzyme
MPLNPLTYARLNDSVDIPITGGESFSLAKQFEPYLEAGAFTIAQPDVGVCGVSEWLRIVSHAYRCGVEVCPHSWHNGLLCVSHAHLLAALPRPRPLELCMVQGPLQWEILHEPPPIEDGHLVLPKGPGWGVDIAEDIEKKFPYIEGDYADHLD